MQFLCSLKPQRMLITVEAFFARQVRYYIDWQPKLRADDCKPQLRSASRKLHGFAAPCMRACLCAHVCKCTYNTWILREWGASITGCECASSPRSILVYREFLKALAPGQRLCNAVAFCSRRRRRERRYAIRAVRCSFLVRFSRSWYGKCAETA